MSVTTGKKSSDRQSMCGEQAECAAQQAQQSTSQVLLWGLIIAFAVFCVLVPMAQKTARKRGMTLIQLVGYVMKTGKLPPPTPVPVAQVTTARILALLGAVSSDLPLLAPPLPAGSPPG